MDDDFGRGRARGRGRGTPAEIRPESQVFHTKYIFYCRFGRNHDFDANRKIMIICIFFKDMMS